MRPSRPRRPARTLACERLEPRQLLSATTTRDSGWFDTFSITPAGADPCGITVCAVETDGSGNRYVVGSLTGAGSIDLDPGPGLAVRQFGGLGTALNSLFVVKLDATGALVWDRSWSTGSANWLSGGAGAIDVAVDQSGSVFISGSFWGTVDFDPGPAVTNLTSAGDWRDQTLDLFILKLNSGGSCQWVKDLALRAPAGSLPEADIAATDDGVIVAGTFNGRVDFNPDAGSDERTSHAGVGGNVLTSTNDVFVLKLTSAAGHYVWCQTIGGAGDDRLADVATDASGNVFAVGGFSDTVDFNPTEIGIFNLSAIEFSADVFVLKLSAGGNFQFARRLPLGAAFSRDARIAVDPTGGLGVAGGLRGSAPNPAGGRTATYPLRLAKLDVLGADVWTADFLPARQPGWVGNNRNTYLNATGLAFDAFGNLFVSGILRGTVDLDPGPGIVSRASVLPQENTASVLLKLAPTGGYVWDKTSFYGVDRDGPAGGVRLAVDHAGDVIEAGAFPEVGGGTVAFVNQIHAPASLLVMAGNGAWTAVASSGSGFTQRQLAAWMPAGGLTNLTAADVDRDGDDDLVGLATDGSWWVGRNDGGTAMVGVRFAAPFRGQQLTPLIGDMDGDGRADLVYRAPNTGMWVLQRSTGAEFGNPELLGQWNAAINWSNVALADVDGDGDRDIVARRPAGDWQVGLYSRSPSSTIVSRVFGNFTSTVNWANLAVVDFDGDGRADVIGRNPATNVWWLGRSDGMAFTNVRLGGFTAGVNWSNVGYGDVDGDYDLDVIARNPATGNWVVGRNDGGAAISTVAFGSWPAAAQWQLVTVGDYNGDGRADVVGLNPANGNLRVSLSTGAGFSDVIWARLAGGVAWTTVRRVRL